MAKYVGYKRPKDTKKTLKQLFVYLGHYKWMLILVAFLVFISAGANVTGTYLIKPVVNRFIVPGNMTGLLNPVIGKKCFVCAYRSYLSPVQYDNLVSVLYRRYSLCYYNLGHIRKLLSKPLSYLSFCRCIYRTCNSTENIFGKAR